MKGPGLKIEFVLPVAALALVAGGLAGTAVEHRHLGGGSFVSACPAQYWTTNPSADQPDFAAAGIRQQNLP
jgi:hypothetical protein